LRLPASRDKKLPRDFGSPRLHVEKNVYLSRAASARTLNREALILAQEAANANASSPATADAPGHAALLKPRTSDVQPKTSDVQPNASSPSAALMSPRPAPD
jgi:hypothetical protein